MFTRSLAILLLLAATASAQTRLIQLSIGTGFFVSIDGHIITNAHVVKSCQSIEIDGAYKGPANILALDSGKDLAVLSIGRPSPMVAPLRWNLESLRTADKVSVLGYPSGAHGELRYNTSYITGLQGPVGEPQWVQIKPVLEKGNSGGPLLDTTGNVIGVVTGMAYIYTDSPTPELVERADLAITLNELRGFLDRAGVRYYQSSSGMLLYADGYLDARSRQFIVKVTCVVG